MHDPAIAQNPRARDLVPARSRSSAGEESDTLREASGAEKTHFMGSKRVIAWLVPACYKMSGSAYSM